MKTARRRKCDLDPDTTVDRIKEAQNAQTAEELHSAMWPTDLHDKMQTEDEIDKAIQNKLDQLVDGDQSHRDMSLCPNLTLRLLMPKQMLSAVQAWGSKE